MACLSLEDRRAKAIMDYSVKLVGGHYEIVLPRKYDNPSLPNNRLQAEQRLQLLKRRLKQDPKTSCKVQRDHAGLPGQRSCSENRNKWILIKQCYA